ncbi:MAG: hypothetical protein EA412_09660 [Chitinophagaceae bacterium]|nr:MAG: hypothetical protein EA412_09660 [Chitinophagaceae bacterium]
MKKLLLLFLPVLFFSCQKLDEVSYNYIPHETNTDITVEDIYYVEGLGMIACGGNRYTDGLWLRKEDHEENWISDSITDKALYKIRFVNPLFGLVIGFDGRIFRTLDGGENWSLYQYGNYHPFQDISIANDTVIYLAGGKSYSNGQITKTISGGTHWESSSFEPAIRCLHFFDKDTGFAAGYGVLMFTHNGGESWHNTAIQGDFFIDMFFVDRNAGFLLGYQGKVLKTVDGGESWQTVLEGNRLFSSRNNPESIHFYDKNHGMITGRNGFTAYTSNSGKTWKKINGIPDIHFKSVFMISTTSAYLAGENGTIIEVFP